MYSPGPNTINGENTVKQNNGENMTGNINEDRKDDIIIEIKEKIKKNPRYIHPANKEFQEDIKRYGFENGNRFICWMQQNGILKSPSNIDREHLNYLAKRKGFKNHNDHRIHLAEEKGFESISDYQNYLANKKGFRNHSNYIINRLNKKGFKNRTDYLEHLAKDKGFKDLRDYHEYIVQRRGYKDLNEYYKEMSWNRGDHSPMSENCECPHYIGIYISQSIAKEILSEIFGYVEEMNVNNPGYDFICRNPRKEFIDKYPQFKLENNKDYKIDSKGPRLIFNNWRDIEQWNFVINMNRTADYFLLIGINNVECNNLEDIFPIYIWFVHKSEIIRERKINDFVSLKVCNNYEHISALEKYELKEIRKTLKIKFE